MPSHVPGVAGACLGDETIAAMLEGGLTEAAAGMARAHLAGCAACRRLVSAAVGAREPERAGSVETAQVPGPASAVARTVREELAPGAVIAGRFRIERLLGEGGMGRVFVARQLGLERLVAVKILRPELARDAIAVQRFDREARLVASLMSEQVVRVFDSGTLPTGEPYLVMELLEGEDLGTMLARGPVSIEHAVAWTLAACEALGEAHALGIVHRDIKPSNLFVTRQGRLKVLDFGLAKLATPSNIAMTAAGATLGSPRYMAPEQITGARDVDARADLWALGATLYHLVTGRPPFVEPTLELIFASILGGTLPPLDGVPPVIAGVIARALARDPAARFATAAELAAALRSESPQGQVSDRFEVLEVLGQGGFATVYRARQRAGGREIALKVFHRDAARSHDRFAREAAIMQRLEHPNTVRMLEHGVGPDGAPFLVLELVRGRTLAAELVRGGIPAARVARIAAQVLKALMESHELGIVHRDVSPSNILLVDHAGEPDFVKLLDFGISAEAESQRLTTTGQVVGTPLYTAPERIAGAPVDARSDLYALGLVMAEALTGRAVFAGESFMALCAQHASPAPVPLTREVVASSLGAVIARAVAKRPGDRFGSAREMLAAIEAVPVSAPVVTRTRSPARLPIAIAAIAVVAAAISIAIAVLREPAAPGEPAAKTIAESGSQAIAAPARSEPPSGSAAGSSTIAAPDAGSSTIAGKGSAGSGSKPGTIIGSSGSGKVVIGSSGPVVIGSKKPGVTIVGPIDQVPAPSPPPPGGPPERTGNGPLGNLGETALRKRAERHGWDVKETTREDFPGCHHTRIQLAERAGTHRWADVFLFECDSPASAQGKLQHPLPDSWVVADGSIALSVSTPEPGGAFANEHASKQLFDVLVVP